MRKAEMKIQETLDWKQLPQIIKMPWFVDQEPNFTYWIQALVIPQEEGDGRSYPSGRDVSAGDAKILGLICDFVSNFAILRSETAPEDATQVMIILESAFQKFRGGRQPKPEDTFGFIDGRKDREFHHVIAGRLSGNPFRKKSEDEIKRFAKYFVLFGVSSSSDILIEIIEEYQRARELYLEVNFWAGTMA